MSSPEEDEDSDEGLLTESQLEEIVDHDEDINLFENLIKDFEEMMSDKEVLQSCIRSFIDNLVKELTLGIIFDLHRKYRTNAYCLEVESGDEEDSNDGDIFQQPNVKKNQETRSVCPNCDGAVAASRFATHLDKCMGMSRLRSSSRRVANNQEKNDNSSNVWDGIPSDDDNDADWSSTKKKRNRKKKKDVKKKTRGEEDDLTKFSDMLHLQDRRSHSMSPADGASSSSSPKKRDKTKKRTRGKDSPSSSMMMSK
ncbi:SAGA associated factor 11kDa isoform X2 [Rhynchophorus ferrugineus]|uniref:SAGA-associated factor 11 n=1 Tax=Rhynchophorus ferrugineus TaxID=354439 RepID=A0A834IC54_RHYFE|nr:hypothetical protein GWI33_008211 [Rhynchophorus ferrugineus]